MTISFGGLASNLPVDSIIQQLLQVEHRPIDLLQQQKQALTVQQGEYTNIANRVSKLQDTINKLVVTATESTSDDLFKAKAAASDQTSIVTASVTSDATPQTLQVEVTHLATATSAKSDSGAYANGIGKIIASGDNVSTLYPGTVSSGNFTLYVNGAASTISVNSTTDTVQDVLNRIKGVAGINDAVITADGKIQLQYAGGTVVKLGSSADTTNFLDLTYLKTGTSNATTTTSSRTLTTINLSASVSTAAANLATTVNAGSTFTIGTTTFDTTGKSLSQVITDINSSSAGVTASYNSATNRLELYSKSTGSQLIYLKDNGAGNFLSAMGLIVGGDSTVSQTAGDNATFSVNGSTLYSSSNTVSSSITGLTGVTLNLLSQAPGTTANITISRDTQKLKDAVTDFVKNYNSVMSLIATDTDSQNKGILAGESALTRFASNVRQTLTNRVSGLSTYDNLTSIGISTGAVGTSTSGVASTTLVFDSSKLDAALAADPDQVRSLFTGTSGIFTALKTKVDAALYDDSANQTDGIFVSFQDFARRRIKELNDSIERGEARLDEREKQLRAQFAASDLAISQLQSQGSALTGLNAQLTANSGRR